MGDRDDLGRRSGRSRGRARVHERDRAEVNERGKRERDRKRSWAARIVLHVHESARTCARVTGLR
jgi:hypothetical protein